jgi:hypothetical protein
VPERTFKSSPNKLLQLVRCTRFEQIEVRFYYLLSVRDMISMEKSSLLKMYEVEPDLDEMQHQL